MTNFGFKTTGEEVCATFTAQIKGRTFLITGASAGGLGAKCATSLATHSPAQIILVSRSEAKVAPVLNEIRSISPEVAATFVPCELTDQDSVRHAAETILNAASTPKIDVVINNAGVMAIQKYTLDKHGNELTLSSNHIGHFLLTSLIMPKILAAGPGARIVNLSSHGHNISRFRFDDPKFDGGKAYNPWEAYGQSKTANVLFSAELAARLKGRGVQSFSVDPGLIMETGLATHLDFNQELPAILEVAERNNPGKFGLSEGPRSVAQGCSSSLVAALDPALEADSGAYIHDCRVWDVMDYAVDPDNAKKLWVHSEELVGRKFDF
ncbi:unnamed protein product [Discula destructiva]